MDPRDRFGPLLDGVGCAACGVGVPIDRIRILAEREDLTFVQLVCGSCATETLGLLAASAELDGVPTLDVASHGGSQTEEEAGSPAPGTVTKADVIAMRTFLAGWSGDLVRLLGDQEGRAR